MTQKNGKKNMMSKQTKLAIKSVIKNELKKEEEIKQHTDGFVYAPVWGATAGAVFDHLTEVAQGILDTQRIGDELKLKHIKVRGTIYNQVGATSNAFNDIRIVVFQYNSQDNTPVASDLLLSNVITASVSSYSARHHDYLRVYNVLYDKTYHIEAGSANAANYGPSGIYAKHIEFDVPLKYAKKKIQFEAASVLTTNGIYVMVIGSHPTIASNPQVALQWATTYSDS